MHGHAAEGHIGPGDCPQSRQQCLDSLSHLTDFSARFFKAKFRHHDFTRK